ncbi:MAG TPA: DsbC family protein [Steroidobacteraceae bacterium]|nr:DsbC family protein [Steroidobacteraceae bacterium]
MRLSKLLILLIGVFALASTQAAPSQHDTEARIKALLTERFPGAGIQFVHATQIPGWFEVATESELVYTDERADVLFVGKLLDTRTKVDLTSQRLSEIHSIDFRILPLAEAVKTVRGNGSRTVAIFEDPNCPYCKQLEGQIKDVTDVTIYTFLYPLEKVHPGATKRARAIWCAPDRADAWAKWMQQGVEPTAQAVCTNDPIDHLQTLGEQLKIVGTPMTFFADGRRVEGVIDRAAMERQLDSSHSAESR